MGHMCVVRPRPNVMSGIDEVVGRKRLVAGCTVLCNLRQAATAWRASSPYRMWSGIVTHTAIAIAKVDDEN